MTTYSVETWDHESQRWHTEAEGVTLWQLRGWLRRLRRDGWTACSVRVEADDLLAAADRDAP